MTNLKRKAWLEKQIQYSQKHILSLTEDIGIMEQRIANMEKDIVSHTSNIAAMQMEIDNK